MTVQDKKLAKKRGRPATGVGQTIGVRMHDDLLEAVDRFIVEEAPGISRPEAIRRLTVEALQKMGLFAVGGDEDRIGTGND